MQSDPLAETEAAARAAIGSGSWDEAQALLAAYCGQAEERVRSLPSAGPEACRLAARVLHLLAWAHQMALTGRAHLSEQIRQLPPLSGYAARTSSDRVQTWRLEA